MGTAMAIHLARAGNETVLWASEFDEPVLQFLTDERRHPALPEHLPESLAVAGPDELEQAAEGLEMAVMGAHSGGARSLARMVTERCEDLPLVVGIAKGLEPETHMRMSEMFAQEVGHERVVSVGGPGLAPELAAGMPTAAVFAAFTEEAAEEAATAFRTSNYHVLVSADLPGVEYCSVVKNVVAIGMGLLDGLGRTTQSEYRNAKAALFTQALREMTQLVVALGGRPETVAGLAGVGDSLVTSLGGRNRIFGELVGDGMLPEVAIRTLNQRGMTVEGWESAQDIGLLAEQAGVEGLVLLEQVHRILFEAEPPSSLLDQLKG
jgi:glycerol-3-phosphate dehydrogenase (NAD(P)+)